MAENLFDPSYLLTATDWAYDSVDGAYYGEYRYIGSKFGTNTNGYPISFDSGVQYKLSGTYKVSGDIATGNGVSFRFIYTDSTTSDIKLSNATSIYTDFEVVSNPGKTVEKLVINYSSGPNNIIYLKNMALYPNGVLLATAKDLVARADISAQGNRIDNIEDAVDTIVVSIKNNAYITADAYTPSGFTWTDNPISGKIADDFRGNVTVDFDVSAYDPSENGVTYYVDAVNGSDENDGLTPTTALAKMSTAYSKSDVSCIILKEGFYIATRNLYQQVIGKNIAIKGEPGKDVYICQTSLTSLSAVAGYSGVYSGSRGNCAGVMDLHNKNADGDPHSDFSNRNDLASAIKKYLGNSGLRSETKCLLWEYYGYFSAQEDTIDAMKSKADFVDAMDVIRQGGLKIDGEKVTDPKTLIKADSFKEDGMLVEKGKKKKVIAKLK